jgi:hypothetical protein
MCEVHLSSLFCILVLAYAPTTGELGRVIELAMPVSWNGTMSWSWLVRWVEPPSWLKLLIDINCKLASPVIQARPMGLVGFEMENPSTRIETMRCMHDLQECAEI